jgi:hypothetical protein
VLTWRPSPTSRPTSLDRWLRIATFQRLYAEARRRAVEAAVSRMSCLALGAVEALARHLDAGAPLVEIKAAVALLGNLKNLGGLDVEERLAKLEERFGQCRSGGPAGDNGSKNAYSERRHDGRGAEQADGEQPGAAGERTGRWLNDGRG